MAGTDHSGTTAVVMGATRGFGAPSRSRCTPRAPMTSTYVYTKQLSPALEPEDIGRRLTNLASSTITHPARTC